MRLLFLTPGTGSYYCGVCMRDNALVRELRNLGHDAVLLPLYLPLTLEEEAATPDSPVFFGGLNVYLQQKFAWFRKAPAWLDRWLDHPRVLRWLGRFSGMTQGPEIGALTLSMLQGEEGAQKREVDKLVEWLGRGEKPDVVWLSTALMAGVARRIREELQVPVLCSLQGEDSFLDGLPEPWRGQCWREAGIRTAELSALVAPSRFFAGLMERRLGLKAGSVTNIPNGIALEGYECPLERPQVPTIGYLARLCFGKGLGTVVDAFIELRQRGKVPEARLICTGTMTLGDEPFLEEQKRKLREAGLEQDVQFRANVSKEEKLAFLKQISLMSVPASYGEAFGLYLIEAMACGVPVVQPRTAAFPEIIDATGGGILVEGFSPQALASEWERLLLDKERLETLGRKGAKSIRESYSMSEMAGRFLALSDKVLSLSKGIDPGE